VTSERMIEMSPTRSRDVTWRADESERANRAAGRSRLGDSRRRARGRHEPGRRHNQAPLRPRAHQSRSRKSFGRRTSSNPGLHAVRTTRRPRVFRTRQAAPERRGIGPKRRAESTTMLRAALPGDDALAPKVGQPDVRRRVANPDFGAKGRRSKGRASSRASRLTRDCLALVTDITSRS
jgi:hypothetical protein